MVIRLTYLYSFDLSHELPEIPEIAGVTIRGLERSEITRLHEIWPVPLNEMASRLERANRCYIAEDENGLVHYSWAQFIGWHYIASAGRIHNIRKGEVWIYHCRTAERARGRGIYPSVLTQILMDSREIGIQKVWIYTDSGNFSSQHGIVTAGFQLSREMRSLQIKKVNLPI